MDRVSAKIGKIRAQVPLMWLAGKRTVFPTPRASSQVHAAENASADDWEISDEDSSDLEARFH